MRQIVIRSQKLLVTLASLGVFLMALGLLYWTGMGGTPRVFYGFDYSYLVVFGFFLALGYYPALVSLDTGGKNSVRQIYVHLLLLFGLGLLILVYSLLTPNFLTPLDPRHDWKEYYYFGAIFATFAFATLLLSAQDRWRIWRLKFVYLLIFLIGFLLVIVSLVTKLDDFMSLGLTDSIDLDVSMWLNFYLYGTIVMLLGLLPMIISGSPEFRDRMHTLRFLWFLMALIGVILYIIPSIGFLDDFLGLGILPLEIVTGFGYWAFLGFGAVFLFLGMLLISSSPQAQGFIQKFRYVFLFILLLGVIQVVIAAIQVLPGSPEVSAILGGQSILDNTIQGMTWDVFFINGTVMTLIAVIFLGSIIFFETEHFGGTTPSIGPALDSLPGVKATPSEIRTYLELVTESNKILVANFKEAARKDQFRPRVYEALVKQIQTRDEVVRSRLSRLRRQLGDKATSRAAVFDSALGERATAIETVLSDEPGPAAAQPTPRMPPPTPSSSIPPATPAPTPSIPTPPPAPSTPAPPVSDQSPLDLIADARSTSIAELRGEMLSELRRLREIFKEE
ncbi:MAG: hypothetical protein ACFFE8_07840 [Candidatus Heimdallarchaeota archaeon]